MLLAALRGPPINTPVPLYPYSPLPYRYREPRGTRGYRGRGIQIAVLLSFPYRTPSLGSLPPLGSTPAREGPPSRVYRYRGQGEGGSLAGS